MERIGGTMYNLDLKKLNSSLVKSIKLCVAVRRHLGKGAVEYSGMMDVEREIREAAAECQRVLGLVEADADRPLLR